MRFLFPKLCAIIIIVLCASSSRLYAQPKTILADPQALESINAVVSSGSQLYHDELRDLQREADKALKVGPLSVTEKKAVPPSGDKHDYMSLGKYWWPDPSKPNGLPYIRRDGEANPETKNFPDPDNFGRMLNAVTALSYGYYYTGNEEYAAHASVLLRAWFLDTATRMNPNLNFAQARPGTTDGSGSGIIDVHQMPLLLDDLGLLSVSQNWSDADRKGIDTWFRQYFQWLHASKNGKKESLAANNHGNWYDVQVAAVAIFLNDTATAAQVIRARKATGIAAQIEPDGSQPLELARTKSLDYSIFNVRALAALATLGERVGVDLWHYTTTDGRSIRKALDYILPYVSGDEKWKRQQIVEAKLFDIYPVLIQASRVYHDQKYADAAAKMAVPKPVLTRLWLTIGK